MDERSPFISVLCHSEWLFYVLSTYWCCPSRSCVVFLACVHLALFLALSLSPGNSFLFHYGVTAKQNKCCLMSWFPEKYRSLTRCNCVTHWRSSAFLLYVPISCKISNRRRCGGLLTSNLAETPTLTQRTELRHAPAFGRWATLHKPTQTHHNCQNPFVLNDNYTTTIYWHWVLVWRSNNSLTHYSHLAGFVAAVAASLQCEESSGPARAVRCTNRFRDFACLYFVAHRAAVTSSWSWRRLLR